MRSMEVMAAKEVHKGKGNFKLSNPQLVEVHDAGDYEISGIVLEGFDIYVSMTLDYAGTPPDNYRVLNGIVMDWVDDNLKELEQQLQPEVDAYFKRQYPNIDISEFDSSTEDFVWDQQVDYLTLVHEDERKVHFEVELVFNIEPVKGKDPE